MDLVPQRRQIEAEDARCGAAIPGGTVQRVSDQSHLEAGHYVGQGHAVLDHAARALARQALDRGPVVELRWQVGQIDALPGEQRHSLDDVSQLTHVSRPVSCHQRVHGFGGHLEPAVRKEAG
jgi:hypothetical protein